MRVCNVFEIISLLPFTIALRGSCDLEQRALDGREVIEHVQRLGNEAREENQHRGEGDAGPERKRGVELREGAVRRVPGVGARDEGGRRRERVDDGRRLQGEKHHEEDEALEVAPRVELEHEPRVGAKHDDGHRRHREQVEVAVAVDGDEGGRSKRRKNRQPHRLAHPPPEAPVRVVNPAQPGRVELRRLCADVFWNVHIVETKHDHRQRGVDDVEALDVDGEEQARARCHGQHRVQVHRQHVGNVLVEHVVGKDREAPVVETSMNEQ
mmetsp:Transcript_20114/g.43485  ORF Transcript_20114/g.43485 Transcript_20114/m.43485 type:complete len:268 (+) Transcript_20114:408-1211(+)